jgi:hypothetical protein
LVAELGGSEKIPLKKGCWLAGSGVALEALVTIPIEKGHPKSERTLMQNNVVASLGGVVVIPY